MYVHNSSSASWLHKVHVFPFRNFNSFYELVQSTMACWLPEAPYLTMVRDGKAHDYAAAVRSQEGQKGIHCRNTFVTQRINRCVFFVFLNDSKTYCARACLGCFVFVCQTSAIMAILCGAISYRFSSNDLSKTTEYCVCIF